MMTKWLAPGPSRLPIGPSHHITVGSIAIHPDKDEILAVQEGEGPSQGLWKIPGGLVDPNETIESAAVREVLFCPWNQRIPDPKRPLRIV